MRQRSLTNLFGGSGLVLAGYLLFQGVAVGAPGLAQCIQTCADRQYFIDTTSSPACLSFDKVTCLDCATGSGQCNALARNPLDCTGVPNQNTFLTIYDINTCTTPCSSVKSSGYTEATQPTGQGTPAGNVVLTQCKTR